MEANGEGFLVANNVTHGNGSEGGSGSGSNGTEFLDLDGLTDFVVVEVNSFLSLLGALVIILGFALQARDQRKAERQHQQTPLPPRWIRSVIFWLSVGDFLASLVRLSFHIIDLLIPVDALICSLQLTIITTVYQMTWVWTLLYSVNCYRAITSDGDRTNTFHWSYHLFGWGLPILTLAPNAYFTLKLYNTYGYYARCFTFIAIHKAVGIKDLVFVLGPLALIFLIIVILSILTRRKIAEKSRRSGILSQREREEQQHVQQRLFHIGFIFFFCWGLTFATYILLLFYNQLPETLAAAMALGVAITAPLQGLLNAILYLWTNEGMRIRYKRELENYCCCWRSSSSSSYDRDRGSALDGLSSSVPFAPDFAFSPSSSFSISTPSSSTPQSHSVVSSSFGLDFREQRSLLTPGGPSSMSISS